MADVELVIKIPEKLYEYIKKHGLCGYCSDREIVSEAIANGKPLKGHGRLIDADSMWNAYHDLDYDFYEALDSVDTIIEADKEQES